ncbi:MAG: hypothetical protein ACYS9Y_05235 [Planctomycetota bacterium]|jgi:ribosomal protein S3
MKEEKEKIDLLFERNAAEQLAGVDWDGLNMAISGRLDQGDQQKSSAVRYRRMIKSAAALAAAAAVVLIAVMVGTDRQTDMQLTEGRSAVVKFSKAEGSAEVEIKQASAKARVMIDIGRPERKVAICNVKITDLNGDLQKEVDRASSWIIISRPEPIFAHNGNNRDIMSMICLF